MSSHPSSAGIGQSTTEGVALKPTMLMEQVTTSMQVVPDKGSWRNWVENTVDCTISMVPCSLAGSSMVLVTLQGGLSPLGIVWSPQIPVEGLAISLCPPLMVTLPAGLGLAMDLLTGWWLLVLNVPCHRALWTHPWHKPFSSHCSFLNWADPVLPVWMGVIICQLDSGSSPSTSSSVKVFKGSMARQSSTHLH